MERKVKYMNNPEYPDFSNFYEKPNDQKDNNDRNSDRNNRKFSGNPKKPAFFYWLVSLGILILLNAFVFPSLTEKSVEEVSYDTFLSYIDKKSVESVQIDDNVIYFSLAETNPKNTKTDKKPLSDISEMFEEPKQVYSTGKAESDTAVTERLYGTGVKFERVIPKEINPWISLILSYVIPIIFLLIVWKFIFKQMSKSGMGGNFMSFGKSNAKVYVKAQTGKTFADVAGQEEAKDALREIVDFLHNPKKYTDIGANLPKGALLVGPPGTGKTLLAQAVAGEAEVPFFSISGSEFVEMFVGMGAAKVRDLFKQATEKAPCIVFIDEIDTIGKKRDAGGISGNDEREQTLNQLLTEMDGFDGKKGVVILAATNRPETLDKALLRPGRFDRRIPVELPDLKGREAILKVHGKKVKTEPNLDYNQIARAASGASGADLANIINEAALRAVRMGRNIVTQSDLEESVEVILAGYQRKGAVVSENEKRIISYHEVGHALVAAMQKKSAPVHKITIIPRTSGALGYTMQIDEDEHFLMSKEELYNKIVTLTGGRVAEELIFGSITTGASNDIEQATKIARSMITRFGMSDKFGFVAFETVNNPYLGTDTTLQCSPETAHLIDGEVMKVVASAYESAKKIITENDKKLHVIANYLLEKETITGEEFLDILKKEDEKEPESDNEEKGEL